MHLCMPGLLLSSCGPGMGLALVQCCDVLCHLCIHTPNRRCIVTRICKRSGTSTCCGGRVYQHLQLQHETFPWVLHQVQMQLPVCSSAAASGEGYTAMLSPAHAWAGLQIGITASCLVDKNHPAHTQPAPISRAWIVSPASGLGANVDHNLGTHRHTHLCGLKQC